MVLYEPESPDRRRFIDELIKVRKRVYQRIVRLFKGFEYFSKDKVVRKLYGKLFYFISFSDHLFKVFFKYLTTKKISEIFKSIFQFHEDRGQPLKGPPMFAQAPLDVFTLYHHVKGKGGMNEVTKKKEWGDIVRLMNFPVSPSAGFTLKKQYVKFLFEV